MEKTEITRNKQIAVAVSMIIILLSMFLSVRYVTASNIYLKAVHEAEDGHLEEAEEGYREAIRLNPWHADAHYELATLLKNEGRTVEALSLMERAIEINGDEADYHLGIGFLYFNSIGDNKKAKEHFEKALALGQDDQLVCYMLARVSEGERNLDKAIFYYKKAIKANPSMVVAHKQLATLYDAKGMDEKAKSHWENVLKIDAKDVDARSYLNDAGQPR
jgi:tetratricopeptide (TPR) repeat protein